MFPKLSDRLVDQVEVKHFFNDTSKMAIVEALSDPINMQTAAYGKLLNKDLSGTSCLTKHDISR